MFDNIDINLRTLYGTDTFQALGGIECIAPKPAVSSDVRVERVKAGDFGLVVTNSGVNCDDVYNVGINCLRDIEVNNFADVKLKTKSKVKTIASVVSGINLKSEEFAINPDQLFNRIICMSQGTNHLNKYFNQQVSPLSFISIWKQ